MEIFEQLNEMYNELRQAGVIRTKKELAEILGISDKGLVKAMKGDPAYATASLFTKLKRFRDEHVKDSQKPSEKTDIEKAIEAIQSSNQITLKAQEQTDRLLSLLELQMGTKPWTVGKKEKGLRDGQK